jgi:hypothetical protein
MPTNAGPINASLKQNKQLIPVQCKNFGLASETVAPVKGNGVTIEPGDRHYRARGLAKNLSHKLLKVKILVSQGDTSTSTRSISVRPASASFTKQVSGELSVKEDVLKSDRTRAAAARTTAGRAAGKSSLMDAVLAFVPEKNALWPLRTGFAATCKTYRRSPGSRASCFSACSGSRTTQDPAAIRV